MPFMIAGLGNPGSRYAETRHNAGFWFLNGVAESTGAVFRSQSRLHAESARVTVHGVDCLLVRPTTFMNHSGQAIRAVMDCSLMVSVPAPVRLVLPTSLVNMAISTTGTTKASTTAIISCFGVLINDSCSSLMRRCLSFGTGSLGGLEALVVSLGWPKQTLNPPL